MRSILAPNRCAAALAATLIAGPALQAHECSLRGVAGTYGYTSTGSIVTPISGPFATLGRVTFTDGGTFTGTQTTSIAGTLVAETVQGTFTVNPDCTGSASVSVFHAGVLARTTQLDLLWDDQEEEVRAIFLTPGTAITISGRRVGRR